MNLSTIHGFPSGQHGAPLGLWMGNGAIDVEVSCKHTVVDSRSGVLLQLGGLA